MRWWWELGGLDWENDRRGQATLAECWSLEFLTLHSNPHPFPKASYREDFSALQRSWAGVFSVQMRGEGECEKSPHTHAWHIALWCQHLIGS